MQSGNLYVYCINNPLSYVDPSGHIVTLANIVGAVIGAGGGALLGTLIANHYGLSGWKRALTIAGFTVGGAALGWFAGPLVEKLALRVAGKIGIIASDAASTLQTEVYSTWQKAEEALRTAYNGVKQVFEIPDGPNR